MSQTIPTMKNSFKFFANTDCRFFPCHENIDNLNCLFCYCPLYPLGEHCGGTFKYIGEQHDVKCCMDCVFPHEASNFNIVIAKLQEHMFPNAPRCCCCLVEGDE